MKRRTRIQYTDTQKGLMWDRWQKGESLHQIARLFDRHHPSIRRVLAATGGIRPPTRRRSVRALTLAEREDVSRALVAGQSIRSIAAALGRAPSTISREIRRNGGAERYRASRADQAAWDRAHRPKTCKLALHPALAKRVADTLQQQWSPQQIAGWLMRTFPDDATCQVSHECNDPAVPAQVRPLKHMPRRVSSCRAPGAGAGGCKTRSSRRSPASRAAGFRSGGGVRTAP